MPRRTETATLTLQGAIDGSNRLFRTTLPMVEGQTDCYLNGRLKVASLDDGYEVLDERTVSLKEAPLPGDTVQVTYSTGVSPGGQAGGVPSGADVRPLADPKVAVRTVAPPVVSVRRRGCDEG